MFDSFEEFQQYLEYDTLSSDVGFATSFKQFLSSQYCEEEWTFIEEVEQWKRMRKDGFVEQAYERQRSLIGQYILVTGKKELNIPQRMKDNILNEHEENKDLSSISIFDEVITTSHTQLKEEKFPLFMASDIFYNFLKRKQEFPDQQEDEENKKQTRANLALRRLSVRITNLIKSPRRNGIFADQLAESTDSELSPTTPPTTASRNNLEHYFRKNSSHSLTSPSAIMKTVSLDEVLFLQQQQAELKLSQQNAATVSMYNGNIQTLNSGSHKTKSLPANVELSLQFPNESLMEEIRTEVKQPKRNRLKSIFMLGRNKKRNE